jgi:HlyD family secretion protein
MWKRLRSVLLVGGMVAALFAGVGFWRSGAVPVVAVTAHTGPLEVWVMTNGVVEPTDPHQLRAPASAFVRTVAVVEGQPVKHGAVLMTLDFAQQKAELARAREELATAQHDLRNAEAGGAADERAQIESDLKKVDAEAAHLRAERDTLTRLLATKAATRQELDQVNLDLARAEATHAALTTKLQELGREAASGVQARRFALDRARETIRMLETQVAAETLRAPADGVVYLLPVRAGGRVETGDLLAAVGDLSRMQVRAFVDEPDLASVQKGQPVQVSWSAVANRVWAGQVERLPGAVIVRGERHVGEVVCALEHSAQLIPNLDVDVRIRVQSRPHALLVPRQAVLSDQKGPYVFVIENGAVQRKAVAIDIASVTDDAILSGLKEGDRLAIPGTADLSNGTRVTITSQTP